jgi:hypothetical protein
MRYTRYDLKRRKNSNVFFIALVIGILALAFISGSIISNMFIKDIDYKSENTTPNKVDNKNVVEKNKNTTEENLKSENTFVAIQCGVFINKDNAIALKEKLSPIGTTFIIEEDNKSRVIMGIYTEENSELILKKLSERKIDSSKIKLKVNSEEVCNTQINEIIGAYLQVNSKFSDDKVKSVQTKQLKEWTSSLKEIDKTSINYAILQSLKEEVKILPDQITKSHLENINLQLFGKIKELK